MTIELSIPEKINQYLQMSEEELDKVLLMLKKKEFFEDPFDNSLEVFIECLKIAYGWGRINGMNYINELMRQ